MEGINTDPRLMNAQYAALNQLQDIGNQGGLTAIDRARMNQISQENATEARGAREALQQNAQRMGRGGSGLSLMDQMLGQQAAATRVSNEGVNTAAIAQQRALDAILQSGQLGGQMQSNEFNQKAQVAAAQDAINKFNAQNRQQVGLYNTTNSNNAQAANLAEKQRIADANVATANQQNLYNNSLSQQDFENKYKKAGGVAGAYQGLGNTYGQQSQMNMNMAGSALGAAVPKK